MRLPRVYNPDDYLWTPEGRVFTDERNSAAWEQIYLDIEAFLVSSGPGCTFHVVMGVQGAGKTTWIRTHHNALGPRAVFLDAALPAARHRARAVKLAKRFRARAVAVWINLPVELALARNAQRPVDEIVPEEAIRSVFGLIEQPTLNEGFDEVLVVDGGAHDDA